MLTWSDLTSHTCSCLLQLETPALSSEAIEVWARGPSDRLFSSNHSEEVGLGVGDMLIDCIMLRHVLAMHVRFWRFWGRQRPPSYESCAVVACTTPCR